MISSSSTSCSQLGSWPRMKGTPPPVTVAVTPFLAGMASSSAAVRMNHPAPDQRVPHGARHLAAGVLGLFGDVPGGLEAVEDVHRGEHRDDQRAKVAAVEVQAQRVGLHVLHALA